MADTEKTKAQLIAERQKMREIIAEGTSEKRGRKLKERSDEGRITQVWETYAHSPIPSLVLSKQGKIVHYNNAMKKLTGYSHREVPDVEAWMPKLYPEEKYRNHVIEVSRKSRQREIDVISEEFVITRKNGEKRTIEFYVVDIIKDGKTTDFQIVQGIDITEQKRAEEALSVSEERFKAQYQGNPAPTFTWQKKGEDFILVDCNYAAVVSTNGKVRKYIGKSAYKMYRNWPDILHDIYRCFSEKTVIKKEIQSQHFMPGKYVAINYAFVPPDLVMVYAEDITERKRAEEALKDSEEKFRDLFENSTDFVYTLDLKGNFTNVNGAAERLTGYTRAELTGMNFRYYTTKDTSKKLFRTFNKIFRTGEPLQDSPFEVIVKNGSRKFFETSVTRLYHGNEIIGFQGSSRDITERKKADEALQVSEDKYRLLFENANDAIYLHEVSREGPRKIFAVNEAACRMLGYTREELLRMTVADIDVPEQMEQIPAILDRLFSEGYAVFETEHVRKDGSRVQVLVSIRTFDLHGAMVMLSIVRDITDRKRAEEALRERDAFNFALFQHNPIETIVTDLEGRVVKCNIAKKKSGDRIPNIGDVMYRDYAGKHKIDMYKEMIECIRMGKLKEFPELKYGDRFLLIKIAPFSMGAIITSQDITERKRAEEALRNSEEMYRSLFENMMNGFAYCQMIYYRSKPQDFIYLDVNKAFEEQTGLKNVVGKKITEVIPGIRESNPELFEIYGRVALSGKPERFETFLPSLKMWLLILVYSPKKEYFVAVFEVITERKLAEETLRESEGRFRAAFDNANSGMVLVDLDGRIMKVNSKMCEIVGYSREELERMTVNDITCPEDMNISQMFFENAVSGEGENKVFEKRYVHKQGHVILGRVSISLVRDSRSNPLHFVSQVEDITESKRAEMQLREDKKKLRSLALELTASEDRERRRIAEYLHDMISQALVVIRMKLGTLQELKDTEPAAVLNNEIRELLEKTIESTRSITFELSSPVLDKLGFEPAVEWLCEKMAEDHGLVVDFKSDSSPKTIDDDSKRFLYRSTRELLMNVVKHASASRAKVSVLRKKGTLCITVDDDGVGFRESLEDNRYMERRFGLFSIRERLDHLGGHMEIDSKPGHGTCISLYAPLGKKKAQKKQE